MILKNCEGVIDKNILGHYLGHYYISQRSCVNRIIRVEHESRGSVRELYHSSVILYCSSSLLISDIRKVNA